MKKRLLCLLISLSIAAPLAIFPALGVESDLPVLPNEPDPVVVQKDAPIPEELPAALKEVPNNVCPVPKTEDLRLLMPQDSGFSLFSARAVEQAVAVEISADGKVAGTIRFTLDSSNHTALLIGSDPGIDGMLVVPSSISCEDTEYTVTAIGDSAFAGQAELTQLWLPHTVSSIGYEAFMNCEQLLAVGTYDDEGTADPYALPQQVSFIGGRAFRGCTRLGGITIPANVDRIDAWTFAYCYSLGRNAAVSFAPGSRLKRIDQGAFYYCIALENITLPQGLESISVQAFSHCASQDANGTLHGLKTMVIPDTVTEIGEKAFSYCGALQSVTIPAGIKVLSSKVFYSCSAMETVDFKGDGLTKMGDSAFFWCTKLKTIRTAGRPGLPTTLEAISRWAFYRCDSLAELDLSMVSALREIEAYAFNESGVVNLTLPQNLKYIRLLAFEGCARLKTINWNRPAEVDADLLVVEEKAFAKTGLETVTVPQLYAGTGLEMFYDCDSLCSVTVDPKARFVPDGAFRDCDNLTAVTLGGTLEKVGQQAFYSCPKLTDVDLEEATSLEVIGPMAFCRTALPSVTLVGPIAEIGLSAFGINRSLTSIEVRNLQNPGGYFSDEAGVLYRVQGTSILLVQYPAGRTDKTFAVPEALTSHNHTQGMGVTAIETYAFSHSEHLDEVTFPSTLRVIGYYAFSHCINLRTANVPAGVTQGEEIFEGSYHMTQVTLPPDLVKLTSSSLPINAKITTVTLPAGVAEIDTVPSPFASLTRLEEILVDPANPNFKSVDGVLFSKDGTILYAYPRGKAGSEYVVPDGVTTIWYSAFSDVTSLTRLTFPASVTTVRTSACDNMPNLERLDIYRDMPDVDINPNDTVAYNGFLTNANESLQVYVNGDPTDRDGAASWVQSFVSVCGNGSGPDKQDVHVDFYKPVTQAEDRFLENGVIYTLKNPAAKTVTVGSNAHYEGSSAFIPDRVIHQGTAYTVTAVEEEAFPNRVQVIRRGDLTELTPSKTDLTYGDVLVLNAPAGVGEGTVITLTANGKSLSAKVSGGVARFPVDKTMVDAFGFGTVTVSATGAAGAEFSLTLSPKTFTKKDLPWYNSSMQELVIEKPYDGTTVVDYTDTEVLRDFAANGETLALRFTGNVPAPVSNQLHTISNLKLEFAGETAGCYRIGSDVAANVRAQVTYGQLYLKEINGIHQQPTFRRVWAAEDGMQLKDCNLSGGVFIAYLPTVANNAVTGYTEVEVQGSITYNEVNHYPGLSSFDEMGVQQNQTYQWVFTPAGNGAYQPVLDNYRFFGTVKPWDPSLVKGPDTMVGKTGENPPLPAYVLSTQSEQAAPQRPVGAQGTVAVSPTAPPTPPAPVTPSVPVSPSTPDTPSKPSGSGVPGSSGAVNEPAKVPTATKKSLFFRCP